jgi:hypothetical protein
MDNDDGQRSANEDFLREQLKSKKRHSKQNKAMCALAENDNKKLLSEVKRLRTENAELKQQLAVNSAPKELQNPITVKQALVRTGVFNVHHNDVLLFGPLLIAAYAKATGKVPIVKQGLKPCFPKEDAELVVKIVEELAPVHLESYWEKKLKAEAAAARAHQQHSPPA